jgi:hypothetical protein
MRQFLSIEQGCYFGVVGEAVGRAFGKQGLAIDDDLEGPGGARDKLDLGAVSFYKQIPRTERTRLVVSDDAVFDSDVQRGGHIH